MRKMQDEVVVHIYNKYDDVKSIKIKNIEESLKTGYITIYTIVSEKYYLVATTGKTGKNISISESIERNNGIEIKESADKNKVKDISEINIPITYFEGE